MGTIIQDMQEIINIARAIQVQINKRKYSDDREKMLKVIKEGLELLIAVDIRKYRDIQGERGDKALLQEAIVILNAAKRAFADIDSWSLNNAYNLVKKIEKLEEHELIEYERWLYDFHNLLFYHGTTSIGLDNIKRYGLVPGKVPWESRDLKRLNILLNRCGFEEGIGSLYLLENVKNSPGIFLTTRKQAAYSYAIHSPEMWSVFVGHENWYKRDFKTSLRRFYGFLVSHQTASMDRLVYEEHMGLMHTNKRSFLSFIKEHCSLNPEEINEAVRLFTKTWRELAQGKPVVLHISVQAPELLEKFPSCRNFEGYDRSTLRKSIDRNNLKITKRIPAKYITQYEFL